MTEEYSYSDFKAKCTECGLGNMMFMHFLLGDMQEAAEKGSDQLNIGTNFLMENGICWIILKVKAKIERLPKWGEDFRVRTWASGLNKIIFSREFEFIGEDGKIFISMSTEWIMAEWDSHRPVIPRKKACLPEIVTQNDRRVFDVPCEKLSFPERESFEGKAVISKYADFSELDRNSHVNNTRYMAWAFDALYKEGVDVFDVRDMDINYISEVRQGEKVDIFVEKDADGKYCVYGFKNGDTKVFCTRLGL